LLLILRVIGLGPARVGFGLGAAAGFGDAGVDGVLVGWWRRNFLIGPEPILH
jgi:hypothetical protein